MADTERLTTRVSGKGQVILTRSIWQQRCWKPENRLLVESTSDGGHLKAAPLFAPTGPEDVYGSLALEGCAEDP